MSWPPPHQYPPPHPYPPNQYASGSFQNQPPPGYTGQTSQGQPYQNHQQYPSQQPAPGGYFPQGNQSYQGHLNYSNPGVPPLAQHGYPPLQSYQYTHHAQPVPPPPQPHVGYPTPATPGFGGPQSQPLPDPNSAATELRRAMKGFGTDEKALIRVLAKYPGEGIDQLKQAYRQQHNRSLDSDVAKETSGHFESGLLSILHGPLMLDVHTLHKALAGAGTNEELLNDVLIGRSNADLRAIKNAYQTTFRRSLEDAVASDLSAKTKRLFSMILAANRAEESAPCLPQAIESDVKEIHKATEARLGTDELVVCSILSTRSDGQIRAIASTYHQIFRIPLEKVIDSEFSGHMKQALTAMVRKASDRAMYDAINLEEAMAGMGTKDVLLVSRIVRAHWDRLHVQQIRGAYQAKYKKDLVGRVQGEVSGDYERLMVAMLE